ncbi:MAG: NAD(P)H-hydrate dehydratase [Bacteroidota bacterium]
MKILDTAQIRALDAYTIQHEPVASIDLMERAALAFTHWLTERFESTRPVKVFCGLGNNGGDGLAIARLLVGKKYQVSVYVLDYSDKRSEDFMANYERLSKLVIIKHIKNVNNFPLIGDDEIFIDAIFGSGLSRPTEGLVKEVIELINEQAAGQPPAWPNRRTGHHAGSNRWTRNSATVVSVDIASGLYADAANPADSTIVHAHFTVAFQVPKLAFLLPQNAPFVGEWTCVDIGLNKAFIAKTPTPYYYLDQLLAESLLKPRSKYAHKGTFGHALLIAGSYGKIGAAVLSAKACLRAGIGLLTVRIPQCGYEIIQTAVPEAMALADDSYENFTFVPPLQPYAVVGIGPGLGKAEETLKAFSDLLLALEQPLEESSDGKRPGLVIDADALNLLADNRELLKRLPTNAILTPHPKEFERLAGKAENDFDRLELLKDFSKTHQVYVVLKGANTAIATPDGTVYFNSTGNPGMATGGTGDVLTGIITALLAQSYSPLETALIGVYQHGLSGDRAAAQRGQSALIASDLIEALGW